jgi:ATP-dependent DNA helicase Q5
LNQDPFENLKDFIEKCLKEPNDCGIVYCRARDACSQVAGRLISKNISAKAYHAGLKNSERDSIQDEWMQGKTKVIVATISFGILYKKLIENFDAISKTNKIN